MGGFVRMVFWSDASVREDACTDPFGDPGRVCIADPLDRDGAFAMGHCNLRLGGQHLDHFAVRGDGDGKGRADPSVGVRWGIPRIRPCLVCMGHAWIDRRMMAGRWSSVSLHPSRCTLMWCDVHGRWSPGHRNRRSQGRWPGSLDGASRRPPVPSGRTSVGDEPRNVSPQRKGMLDAFPPVLPLVSPRIPPGPFVRLPFFLPIDRKPVPYRPVERPIDPLSSSPKKGVHFPWGFGTFVSTVPTTRPTRIPPCKASTCEAPRRMRMEEDRRKGRREEGRTDVRFRGVENGARKACPPSSEEVQWLGNTRERWKRCRVASQQTTARGTPCVDGKEKRWSSYATNPRKTKVPTKERKTRTCPPGSRHIRSWKGSNTIPWSANCARWMHRPRAGGKNWKP